MLIWFYQSKKEKEMKRNNTRFACIKEALRIESRNEKMQFFLEFKTMNNMQELPIWYLLVEYWCRERKRYGLTIPFILGTIESVDIKALLLEISKSKYSEYIILKYCWDLNLFRDMYT